MTTREPSNLLNHRVSRARKLLSLPHGSRNRLAPGSFDLAKGEAEQTVNLDLTVINDLANTGSRHTVLLAQLLELTVAVTAQRNDRSGRGLREQPVSYTHLTLPTIYSV